MNPNLQVYFLPSTLQPENLVDRVVIVVDILRATTTIAAALNAGASCIVPCPSIELARQTHDQLGDCSVMGGERHGKRIDGFHCGNSPLEYTPDVIKDKTLILTTTNGTVAMEKCRQAKRILMGSFVNLAAVINEVWAEEKITVLCSGTDGFVTSEDVLFAGALVERIDKNVPEVSIDDGAQTALNHWLLVQKRISREDFELADFMRTARGGKNLVRIGLDSDIQFCAQIDTIQNVPVLDVGEWTIRAD